MLGSVSLNIVLEKDWQPEELDYVVGEGGAVSSQRAPASILWLLQEQEMMQTLTWQCHTPAGRAGQRRATELCTFPRQDV